jgi:hypothetical protein
LSSTDWTTFNSKQNTITNPVTGTGTSGQVPLWNGTSSQTNSIISQVDFSASPDVFINTSALRGVIIGNGISRITNMSLVVGGNMAIKENFGYYIERSGGVNSKVIDSTTGFLTNIYSPASTSGGINFLSASANPLFRIFANTGNVLIQNGGTFTDAGFRLDVNGTARVQGVLTATADAVVNGVNVGIGGGAITSNTRVGVNALNANTTGIQNTAFGREALLNNTTSNNNSAFGNNTLRSNTTGFQNTAIGASALQVNNGNNNTATGVQTLQSNTTGFSNTANGFNALNLNTTGFSNTAVGATALQSNTTGSNNTANGVNAGRFIADGTTVNSITNNSVFIGSDSRAAADNQTNQIVIGHTAIGLGSNTTVIGNSSTTFGRWFGNLLVGTSTNAGFALDVNGTARVQGQLTTIGSGITSGSFSLISQNSSNENILRVRNDGALLIGNIAASAANLISPVDASFNPSISGGNLGIFLQGGFGSTGRIVLRQNTNLTSTSGNQGVLFVNATFNPTSGTGVFESATFNPTINQTGGANGITRGLFINPTLTSAADWRAIEVTSGGAYINTTSVQGSAILQADSTTKGFLPPRMTTTQKNAIASPATGLVVYDNTLNKLSVFTGLVWETVTSL